MNKAGQEPNFILPRRAVRRMVGLGRLKETSTSHRGRTTAKTMVVTKSPKQTLDAVDIQLDLGRDALPSQKGNMGKLLNSTGTSTGAACFVGSD